MARIKVDRYRVDLFPGRPPDIVLYSDGGRRELGRCSFPTEAPAERAERAADDVIDLRFEPAQYQHVLDLLRAESVWLDDGRMKLTTDRGADEAGE